jgi:hypothetical protein
MKIEYLPAETHFWSIMKMQVNGLYWIEFSLSTEMEIWVSVREIGSMSYIINWCACGDFLLSCPLINCLLHYIDTDDLQDLPRSIRNPPFWSDEEFSPYMKFCKQIHPDLDINEMGRQCHKYIQLIPESPLKTFFDKIKTIYL